MFDPRDHAGGPGGDGAMVLTWGDFVRFALTLAYDGTDFHGFWRAPGLRTVGSELDAAFARCGLEGVQAVCASRTDRGVHAAGQVVHFDAPRPFDPLGFLRTLSHQCPLDLRPCAIASVPRDWHAAHAVTQKTYAYTIDSSVLGDPFAARFAWQVPRLRPLQELQDLASSLLGSFDATTLRSRGEHRQNLFCMITQAQWFQEKKRCIFTITADRFTYHLVRSLVGSMVHGLDPRLPSSTRQQAPAKGLCLTSVQHDPNPVWMNLDLDGPQGASKVERWRADARVFPADEDVGAPGKPTFEAPWEGPHSLDCRRQEES